MKLKYYAIVDNVKEAIEYYSKIFDVNVIKDSSKSRHGYIKLYNQISILLYDNPVIMSKPGYYIIRMEDEEKDIFLKAWKNINNSNLINMSIPLTDARWGTTFFEFQDKYGYMWDIEISTNAIKNIK